MTYEELQSEYVKALGRQAEAERIAEQLRVTVYELQFKLITSEGQLAIYKMQADRYARIALVG